jgi:hypothetical protein
VRKGIFCLILFFAMLHCNNLSYAQDSKSVKAQKTKDKDQTIVIDAQKGLSGLAISRNDIENSKNKEGDAFSAKIVEDVKSKDTVVISSGAVLKGFISKIDEPKNFPCRDGAVYVSMNEIEMPDGKIVNISESKIKTIIYSPYRMGVKNKIIGRFPAVLCYYGLLLPLAATTDIAGPLVTCAATGGAALVGATAGYIFPDKGRSKTVSVINRSIDATPVGIAKDICFKGEGVEIKSGDGLIITFDAKTIQKILEKRNMQVNVVEANKPWF